MSWLSISILQAELFLPGGDGLWRDDTQLSNGSSGLVAKNGIMFLANDFGTLNTYKKRRNKRFLKTRRHGSASKADKCEPT